jgi:diguanylate cyclase (GGDEF)-like protein
MGLQNQKQFSDIVPQIDASLGLEFTSGMTMEELLAKVSHLDEKTAVILPVFLRDANNVRFSTEKSVSLITQACNRPVFGFHNAYLKYGLTGGSITDGYDQGIFAAELAERVLNGETASDIPIVERTPHRFFFDYNALKKFQISRNHLPPTSTVVNAPNSFYEKYKREVDLAICLFLLLFILVIAQQVQIRRGEKRKEEIESEARTDCLTGTIPRKYFIPEVKGQLEECRIDGKKLTLCYCDLNGLKSVNDTFGHREGDNYIVSMVHLIQSTIRACDRIYRMGGDEFMIVFDDCIADGAKNRIRDIREKLADLNKKPDSKYEKGMSFGCAEFDPANPKTLNQLLEQTDELMYLDKNRQGVQEKKVLSNAG